MRAAHKTRATRGVGSVHATGATKTGAHEIAQKKSNPKPKGVMYAHEQRPV